MREASLPGRGLPGGSDRGAPPHQTLWDFTATDDVSFAVRRGDLRPCWPQRRGQVHHLQDGVRPAAPEQRTGAGDRHRSGHQPLGGASAPRLRGPEVLPLQAAHRGQGLSFFAGHLRPVPGRQQQTRIDAMWWGVRPRPWLGQQTESLPLACASAYRHSPCSTSRRCCFSTSPPVGRSCHPAGFLVPHQRPGRSMA